MKGKKGVGFPFTIVPGAAGAILGDSGGWNTQPVIIILRKALWYPVAVADSLAFRPDV